MNDIREFTVSEISFEIKKFVETKFNKVRIRGEIFGAKRADSGHWYLSLKDDNAVISAVCWKGVAAQFPVKPEDGLEIIATGKVTTFAGKSSYQLVIEQMEVAGSGALLKLLEERKKKFSDLGYFDAVNKKPLPFLPKTIGVVTSASGAVIRDIIHRIKDRFPCHILLWATPVQGEGSADKIAKAINGLNSLPHGSIPRPDVIIVARGGGSLEDLWSFNEEVVIQAVYDSQIPIISAVGHETDTMLIDYVADVRAPTPTGAAEIAVPVKSELTTQINNLDNRLRNGVLRFMSEKKNRIHDLSRGIPNLEQILLENTQKLDDRIERLNSSFKYYISTKNQKLELTQLKPYLISHLFDKNTDEVNNLSIRLNSVSVESVLKRGFAWVKNEKQHTIYNIEQANKAKSFEIKFIDGTVKTSNFGRKKNELQGDLFNL